MRTPRSFHEKLDVIARLFFCAGIAYVAAIFFTYQLWSRPHVLAAWICYLLAACCTLALLLRARLRVAMFFAATASILAGLAFETLLEVGRLRQEAAWSAKVTEVTGIEQSRPGQPPEFRSLADPEVRGMRCAAMATQATDKTLLPLGGWPHRQTLLGNELGYEAVYLADRFGFNNPDEVHDRRKDRAAVVVLGDSFAQGVAVRPEANAAAALRRRGHDVLNLGCAGNGPLAELGSYREYGRRFKPDVVIWFYLESNDLANLAGESRTILRQYLQPGFTQNLAGRNEHIVRFLDDLVVPRYRPQWPPARVITFANTWALVSALTTSQEQRVNDLREVTAKLHDDVAADGARLMVVYLPDPDAVARSTRRENCFYSPSTCKSRVLQVFAERSIPVLDFEAVLRSLDDPLQVYAFRIGGQARGHFTEEGYMMLGEAIAGELDRVRR
jgi:hypothetical protein